MLYFKKRVVLKRVFFITLIGFYLSGCSSKSINPTLSMTPPKYVEQMPSKEEDNINNNPGSLFKNSDNLFSDTKAKKVNDIVTVVITENISQISQASKKLSESNQNNGGLFDASISGGVSIGGKNYGLKKTGISLNLPSMNSNRTFTGSGTQNTKQQFTTTISARIVKILKNGNYYIYGTKEMLLNGEKQIVQISGVIRPEDISADNSIDSKYIADEKISYKSQGDINEYTKPNWFIKFWNKIIPW